MSISPPEITLLVPCFNAAAYLPRLLACARRQTVPFARIVCFDDGSTDDTTAVARAEGAEVIVGAENVGAGEARNQLWRAAQTEWVHFHDADDLMHEQFVELMTGQITATTDVLICNAEWKREDTGEVELTWRYSQSALQDCPVDYLLQHPVGGINGLYRRSALERVGGFNPRLAVWEDADLHVRLAASGARFAVVERTLVTAMRRNDSVSAPMRRNWRNRLDALRGYAADLAVEHRPVIVSQLESAARGLLRWGDPDSAREALALAATLGGDPPTSASLVVRLCKRLFGPFAALRVQTLARRN